MERFDVVVLGAGFGGLGAALRLAELGARVCVLERLSYPGGCASTFRRRGHAFESGATLFSGLGADELFGRWAREHAMPVQFRTLDPVMELRSPTGRLPVDHDRRRFWARLAEAPGAPAESLLAFANYQEQVADSLWALFARPDLLPPFDWRALLTHLGRLPDYRHLIPALGRPLEAILRRFGLENYAPLRAYLDSTCQITVQCSSAEAEAPLALAAMDYVFRGTGHVHGGIGELASGMVAAIRSLGGEVRFADRAMGLERSGDTWRVRSRRGEIESPHVVANLLPKAILSLLEDTSPPRNLLRRSKRVRKGWGAAMIYAAIDPPEDAEPHHIDIVQDPSQPYVEGNHIFVSVSGADETERAPEHRRTVTVSTHVDLEHLTQLPEAEQGPYIDAIHARMRDGLSRFVPELWDRRQLEMTASPRTFERFTGRPDGFVGGIPRRAGLGTYFDLTAPEVLPGLHLVGDSVFPGQSTLATALGGVKVAEKLGKALTARAPARPRPPLRAGTQSAPAD